MGFQVGCQVRQSQALRTWEAPSVTMKGGPEADQVIVPYFCDDYAESECDLRTSRVMGLLGRRRVLVANRFGANPLHRRQDFVSEFKRVGDFQVFAEHFSFRKSEFGIVCLPSRLTEGRTRRHEREAGCDGRGWCRPTSDATTDGEAVWSKRRRFEVPAQLTASLEQELQIDASLKILSR